MTATLRLYEYADALDGIRAQLFDAEGDLTPEIEAALNAAESDFATKAERVALFIRELQSNAKAVKEEATRLTARAAQYERTAEGLKHYLQREMERVEIPRVDGKLISVRLQKSPPSVVSSLSEDALREIPAAYVAIVPESYRINAKQVIEAWKDGRPLPAGIEVVQGQHLRFG